MARELKKPKSKRKSASESVRLLRQIKGKFLSAKEAARAFGVAIPNARARLQHLISRGLIRRRAAGEYEVLESLSRDVDGTQSHVIYNEQLNFRPFHEIRVVFPDSDAAWEINEERTSARTGGAWRQILRARVTGPHGQIVDVFVR